MRLLVGSAKRELAPTLGIPMAPGPTLAPRRSGPILDPLHVRAVVLDDGHTRVALVGCDLNHLNWCVSDRAKQQIQQSLGLEPKSVLIWATQTHSAPSLRFIRGGDLDSRLARALPDLIEQTVGQAIDSASPSEISLFQSELANMTVNRVRAEDPVDRRVRGLQAAGRDGRRTVLFHFACPPVHMPFDCGMVSADFLGFAVSNLERDSIFTLFLPGASGDISPKGAGKGPVAALELGEALAETIRAALDDARAWNATPLKGAARLVDVALDAKDARREALDFLFRRKVRPGLEILAQTSFLREWAVQTLAQTGRVPEEGLRIELQAVALGDLLLVGLPLQIVTPLSALIENEPAFAERWVVECVGDTFGCAVLPRDWEEGTHQAVVLPKLHGLPPFARSTGDSLIEAVRALAQQLRGPSRPGPENRGESK